MSAHNRLSLLDDFGNCSQFKILSTQSQSNLLEKKVKCKSDLVITNLNVLRKFRHGKRYDIFEKEILNDCKLKKQETNENSIVESQEDGKINQMIIDNNNTREHVSTKQIIIEKCINYASHRIEFQMKAFSGVIKKNEDFILHVVQYKSELQEEESKVRKELDGIKIEEAAIEDKILNVEKESVALEQTDNDTDLEIEKYEKQFDSFTANEKQLNKLKIDLESVSNELQEKKNFASEQENSIANINTTKKELIDMCEELIKTKTKLQENLKQLEIKMEQFSKLMMKFTNKAEIFQLESDDKFLSILACDEYLESKLKLETIINDNKTLMEELELLHKRDESSVKSSNDLDHEINLEKETLAKLEKQKQSFENDLREEKKIYKEEMLKIQEEDKLTARKIQQLHTEAENIRMEELQGQQAFAASKVQWHQKFEEELEKLNKLKGKESPTNSSPTNFLQESVSTLKSRPPSQHEKVRTSSISSKRKSISSSSARSGKQIKLNTPFIESGLDEPDTDEENDFNITFNTDTEL